MNPTYLSRAFRKARGDSGAYEHVLKGERPGFRALRSHGAHLYREAGYPEQYVLALLAHRSVDLTRYYADHAYESRYINVEPGPR